MEREIYRTTNTMAAIFVAFVCLLSAVSCEKAGADRTGQISLKVRTFETKASITTTHGLEALGGFVMNAYVDNEYYDFTVSPAVKKGDAGSYIASTNSNTANVHFHTGVWTIDNNKNWVANIKTRFFCHAPAEMTHAEWATGGSRTNVVHKWNIADHEDETTFSYAMQAEGQTDPVSGDPIDADNCTDLLFAYAEKTYNGTSDNIDLTFHHALSRVTFAVSPNDGSFDTSLKIKSIEVLNVPSSGDCLFDGSANTFSWSNYGTKKNYAQSYNCKFATKPSGWTEGTYTKDSNTYKIYTADNSFFLIPHTMSSVQLRIVFEDAGGEIPRTVTLPNDTWQAEKYYKYKIGATVLGRVITVDVTLDEWINYDDKLVI